MLKRAFLIFVILTLTLTLTTTALAQSYTYNVSEMTVNAFWNEDGTLSLDYVITFQNDPGAHVIDFVDLAMPNDYFDESSIYADSNGQTLTDISSSGYLGEGSGVAIGMDGQAIPPGGSGTLHVFVGKIERVLYEDTGEDAYASAVLVPARFLSDNAHGTTNTVVSFHLPPGVQPDEPRWHESPSGWPAEPETSIDSEGRVVYTWRNPQASVWAEDAFGASFPLSYVPESAIVRPSPFAGLATFFENIIPCLLPLSCIGFFVAMFALGVYGDKRRKLQYLPPKIAVEGHGIKRGLTAVEAALLMEQPMDKVMTMILFGLVKKNAAVVKSQEPLIIQAIEPAPDKLWAYETDFLEAFKKPAGREQQKALQAMMVALLRSLQEKMKGFSKKETVAYYDDIMKKAWAQVEQAGTPEVKSQKFDEYMEWTMLDRDWNDRTRDVFRTGPVFVPVWWPRYSPSYGGGMTGMSRPTSSGGGQGGGFSMPTLPGADFAASVVGGVQSFSSRVVGNITDFTSGVTNVTNPVPKTTSGSYRGGGGGGGRSCACACACAGCACACAGGGR